MTAPVVDEALIEAIAEALYRADCQADGLSPDLAAMAAEVWSEETDIRETYVNKARAAVAAMVERLGLTEERRAHTRTGPGKCSCGFDAYKTRGIMLDYTSLTQAHFRAAQLGKVPTGRRLVTPWREVQP